MMKRLRPNILRNYKDPEHILRYSAQKFLYAALLILAVLVLGSIGYIIIEGMNPLESLYMTVITIATVGFQEVAPLSNHGRIFTIILILLGIGVGGYAVGTIATLVVEGQLLDIFRGRRMVREITALENHVIICGYGKIGSEVCVCLAAANHDFIVIDKDIEKIDTAFGLGYLAAVGEATDDDTLLKCGIKRASGLISAISDDTANVYLVLTARALNDKLYIIARGVTESLNKKMIRAGADRVVSPYEIGARRMAALMIRPQIVDFLEALSPASSIGLRIERVEIGENCRLSGKRLDESHIKRDTAGALVIGIEKHGKPMKINPPGDVKLEPNDVLLTIGSDEQIEILRELAK